MLGELIIKRRKIFSKEVWRNAHKFVGEDRLLSDHSSGAIDSVVRELCEADYDHAIDGSSNVASQCLRTLSMRRAFYEQQDHAKH